MVKIVPFTVDLENPIVEFIEYVAARDGVDVRDVVVLALVDMLMRLCSDESSSLKLARYLRDDASKRKPSRGKRPDI